MAMDAKPNFHQPEKSFRNVSDVLTDGLPLKGEKSISIRL